MMMIMKEQSQRHRQHFSRKKNKKRDRNYSYTNTFIILDRKKRNKICTAPETATFLPLNLFFSVMGILLVAVADSLVTTLRPG
eukprot:scaffold6387_cov88-Cylindrotheca_fusiformis.AAC.4